ncbi:Ca2+-binding protein, RTX toxin-related [Rhizobium tibeticum]|uniref:Ca2+-binding protein, RTX toxin-related n=1 Tax=Rhizobium tibeticum TaxID=501024 RepID=A0A1H8UHA2_9HYPH|nr:peroxidase family protein [Rhizobium tibeticum]SEI17413.1 Cyclolysin [Rhizobium tibeticum]SEP02407.1 Ca2+-binding protein, RTX toxin-related [Rhizobium tibeticum]
MVSYIRSDLEFILKQIKIAEAHAAGQPLYGPGGLIPTYNLAWGLRTVDGSYNNLLNPEWGAADNPFPEHLGTDYRPASGTPLDMDGPGPAPAVPTAANYNPSSNPGSIVVDGSVRTISNLIVDQTLGNPSAILTGLQRAGIVAPSEQMAVTAEISAAYEPLKPLFNAVGVAERDYAEASAAASASPTNAALQQAAADALVDLTAAREALDAEDDALMALLEANGIELEGANVRITNSAPDEGLSAPFNSWFTLFGQFFDHGLDLVAKGGSGTVFIPLQPDDPLYDPTSPTNFMVLTRATVGAGQDGIMNTADDVRPMNNTTSFVDQNQTYTSHPSHQVFLRQYVLVDGRPVATGNLIQGADGGMATWGDVKAQARDILGIDLTDYHVGNLPLLATDAYGNFIPGPTGFPQVVMVGPPSTLASGSPASPLGMVTIAPDGPDQGTAPDITHLAVRTGHAFLADIAHNAVPEGKIDDGDTEIGLGNPGNGATEYDNELLDAHYIAGDGRVNENIGLTAVHHVFHSEHNRLAQHTKEVVLADAIAMLNDGASQAEAVAFLNEWLSVDVTEVPTSLAGLSWDGERLFQAAKFGTEMQYQHLVFEEFARKIQPNINVFLVPDGFDVTIDPSIVAEFAHVVYRFGHSMLTETIDRFDPTFTEDQIGLIEGFLNPIQFRNNGTDAAVDDDISAGAVIRGMTRQVGNEIDEFVTSALRNNLLGLPLDLATINLARGRDVGVPSLNAAREQFYNASNQDSLLKPYESWVDFAGHLKHEASIINFVAAYGTHSLITGETTIEGKRDAAMALIFGTSFGSVVVPTDPTALAAFHADRLDFLNATGAYAGGSLGGLNNVDLWIGGLAEQIMPFGGMLGSTFNFVFELQMEKLQNGDRFYYLQRLDGLHLFGEMENNSFAAMIMRNTDATHLPSDVFSTPGLILEVDQTKQFNDLDGNGSLESADPVGGGILTPLVVRNNPATAGADTNYLKYTGGDHVVLGGTNNADILIAGIGDDTLYGDGGNDRLEGGFGNDIINAGDGDDIILDSGGDDNIKAGAGNDVVHAGPGLDLVMGNDGQDFIFLGTDMGSEVFAGTGNDFIYGNKNAERILGNEGNDWIETGTFDGAPGDNFDEIFAHDGIAGHDVFLGDGGFDEFIGEGGDDIMVGSAGRGKMVGMSGFDWATYKDNTFGVNADLSIPIIFDEAPTLPTNAALDEYESMEGLSGTRFNDVLSGTEDVAVDRAPLSAGGTTGYLGSVLSAEGIALINGLQEVLGAGVTTFDGGDIILGGDGSDAIMGRGGDDIIDGDKWLDVNIAVMSGIGPDGGIGTVLEVHKSMTTLAAKMFNGTYNPGQLRIIREIKTDDTPGNDIDTARYQGNRSEYAFAGNADGSIQITHTIEDQLDGSDKIRNVEKLQFLDGTMGILVGTNGPDVLNGSEQDDLILGLDGADVLNGNGGNDILVGGPNTNTSGSASDDFNNQTLSGGSGWASAWVEVGDNSGTNSASQGQIRIDNNNSNALQLRDDDNDTGNGTATIQRTINLAAATTATISFTYSENSFDAGETVVVEFSPNGVAPFQLIQTINNNSNNGSVMNFALTGPFTANALLRFTVSGTNANSGANPGDVVNIDGLVINYSSSEVLNGGTGDDTYIYNPGDGSDIINEVANGGAADRLSIVSTTIDPLTLLPVLTGLNAQDDNGGTANGNLVISANGGTINVAGHFTGGNAQTGIERINFNNATYEGYLLGADDYLVSRADPGNRDAGGVNLSASLVNNFIVGEQGTNDEITGGAGNDIIIGGTGDNALAGGLGDDLLIGGSGAGDNDILDGGADLDTMVGLGGSDTYIVDDVGDVVVEALNAGTDEVQTLLATLSLETMANVENLTYTGVDADQFIGTGNALGNVITGGDLADTLTGLAGADTLNGGLGADTMVGGADNDVYFVDDAGDVVTELTLGGTDRVESDIDYTLGAEVENLDLNNNAVTGRGNSVANTINGNGATNQLFGGAGNDTLNGNDGNDVLDGGADNDTLNGGDDNDTIIGGAGNDIIDVGGGVNTIVYNAAGFGNDIINSFDATGGTPATQDRIDLSGFGITAANFATRVTIEDVIDAGTDDTRVTVRDAGGATIGTIFIEEVDGLDITVSDFTLATAGNVINGTATGATHNGTANADTINALGGNDTVNAGAGNDIVNGGTGNDTLNGDAGDDTLNWNANNAAANSLANSDGRDIVNGGTEGGAGDTFVITGNGAVAETYRIYTRAAWDALAGNNGANLNAATEIVITRGPNTDFANSVIAELREIEEIRINGTDPAGNGSAGGDTFEVIGDFSGTSLRLNTITIDGNAGDDTIDISALTSAHRIVFRSNGGNDTIVGTLRPQDVIELPAGTVAADYDEVTDENGVTTLSDGTNSISYRADGSPQVTDHDDDDDDNEEEDDSDAPSVPVAARMLVGTTAADVLIGAAAADTLLGGGAGDTLAGEGGNDILRGEDGDDVLLGGAGNDTMGGGAGDDEMHGGAGDDMLFGNGNADFAYGDEGDDFIETGAGDDSAWGGAGDDTVIATSGDGNDRYWGEAGSDTLDYSVATANLTVDLGNGFMGRGQVSGGNSGTDVIYGFENFVGGSGHDVITATTAVNVMDGGAGNDTFQFQSVAAAHGDTIYGFQPGDKISFSAIDANEGTNGKQSFTLNAGSTLTAAGQVAISHEVRDGEEVTLIRATTDADPDADLELVLIGRHNLTANDFNGVS